MLTVSYCKTPPSASVAQAVLADHRLFRQFAPLRYRISGCHTRYAAPKNRLKENYLGDDRSGLAPLIQDWEVPRLLLPGSKASLQRHRLRGTEATVRPAGAHTYAVREGGDGAVGVAREACAVAVRWRFRGIVPDASEVDGATDTGQGPREPCSLSTLRLHVRWSEPDKLTNQPHTATQRSGSNCSQAEARSHPTGSRSTTTPDLGTNSVSFISRSSQPLLIG